MTDIGPGTLVECVDDGPARDGVVLPIQRGQVYTIREAELGVWGWAVRLVEAPDPPPRPTFTQWYRGERFRPVNSDMTELFRSLVEDVPEVVG